MKKVVVLILVLGLITSLFAGCGSSSKDTATSTDKSTPATQTAEKKKVTISYMLSQGWIEDVEKDLGKKFADSTGITVDYQVIPADQYFNVLLTV